MTLLLTGGTGLIGRQLGIELVKRGHKIIGLTRDKARAELDAPFPATWIECDISKTVPDLSLYSIDGVFHLAGESVGDKNWSAEQKEKIKLSRTQGTANLSLALDQQNNVQFFIGASAMGFYGFTEGDRMATEKDPVGRGFLADVTNAWEMASETISKNTRTVLLRIGVVLSTEGGALPKMLFPAQIFASSSLGNGQQWMSWVHIDDVISAFIFSMENSSLRGACNLVAPKSCQQKEMAQEIAQQMKSLYGPPVPGFMISLIMGEQASLALLSLRVSSDKLQNAGFQFRYPDISSALADILKGWQDGVAIKTYRQFFARKREHVFEFFSDAKNLEKITPEFLNFKIKNMSTPQIEQGTLLDYRIKIHGIPVNWRTCIETWDPNNIFTDTQLKGPYSLWHHTHRFEDLAGGTLMTDIIRYKVPMGLIGRAASQAWVDKDIENIFEYRKTVIKKYF